MSSWKCRNCSLNNSKSAGRCIACFTLNPAKFWQCQQCDFVNKFTANKCIACLNIKIPSTQIGNTWSKEYLNHEPLDTSGFKMIIYKNKPYIIIVSFLKRNIEIKMLDLTNNINLTTNKPRQYPITREESYWQKSNISYCMSHDETKLFMFIAARHFTGVGHGNEAMMKLIIYDLESQTIRKQYTINGKRYFDIFDIKTIILVQNDDDTNNNVDITQQTPYNVINNWTRKMAENSGDDGVGFLLIPNDVYILINTFYSFCAIYNSLQVFIFTNIGSFGAKDRTWEMFHGLLRMKDNNDNIDVDTMYIPKKKFKIADLTEGYPEDVWNYLFPLRIGYGVYMVFREMTWRIDLETCTIKQSVSLCPYKYIGDGRDPSLMLFDDFEALSNYGNKRYFYFIGKENLRRREYALWCYDKTEMQYVVLKRNVTRNPVRLDIETSYDMMVNDGCLFLAGREGFEFRGVVFKLQFKPL